MFRNIKYFAFLLCTFSLSAQTIMTETGFKLITDSPIIRLDASTPDEISFFSNCVHCQYGNLDFSYFQIDLVKSNLNTMYKDNYQFMQRGNLPVSKYPAKSNTYFDIKKYKEVEFNDNGSIDTYNIVEFSHDYVYKPLRISGERFVYLATSKYYGSISLFTGNNKTSKPTKTDFPFFNRDGFYWISDFYSCSLNNRSFVSIKKSNRISELAEVDYVYIINNDTNKIEQKISINSKELGYGGSCIFYPLADTSEFVVLYHNIFGNYDKSNKNYGITMHYYSSNTVTAKGKYVKAWETKLSSDFTSVGAISAVNGQIIVGGTSKNGGYLGYENPYLNIFDIKTGKFKKEYYIPFKADGKGQTVYNIVPLQTSSGISPDGKYVKSGLYGGNSGDVLICCQPYKSKFEESGFGKGILIRDYLNSDGTFYNNLFNDETYKQNKPKKSETPCVQNRLEDLPKFSEKFEVLTHIVKRYNSDKTLNSYCWIAQDKITKKIGIVSNAGKIVIPFEYDCQDYVFYDKNFAENEVYFLLTRNGKKGVVDLKNKIVVNFEYDAIDIKGECYYAVGLKDGKYGIINLKDGNILIDFKYDRLSSLNYGYNWEPCDVVHAKKGNFTGFIDFKENIVFDNNDVPEGKFLEEFEKTMRERNLIMQK